MSLPLIKPDAALSKSFSMQNQGKERKKIPQHRASKPATTIHGLVLEETEQ